MSSPSSSPSSPIGLHRALEPAGVLPQAAARLDARPQLWPDEVRVRLETLNLDAASYRQLAGAHTGPDGEVDGTAVRAEVLDIVATRGKMQNPVTGSGGMLIGTVDEVGPDSPLGLRPGDRVATLVSLSLTPLQVDDGLAGWDGRSEQVPAAGHAILFGRSIAARLPDDLDATLALMVMDVCGAPALVARVVRQYVERGRAPAVAVVGAAGKSGSLALMAAALLYVVSPVDLVPEAFIPFLGLADDAVVAAWLAGRLLADTADFLGWERSAHQSTRQGSDVVQGHVVR